MDTRNKSTAKTPETGEALAKVKASSKAWLRAVQQDKKRRETQERSQEKAAPRVSRQDGDDEVNYEEEEASEQIGDPPKEKEVDSSELSSEEEEGDSQPSDEEEENSKAPEEDDPRNMVQDLGVSRTKGLGKLHPFFQKGLGELGEDVPQNKKGAAIRDRFDASRKKWEPVNWLKSMIKANSAWAKRDCTQSMMTLLMWARNVSEW